MSVQVECKSWGMSMSTSIYAYCMLHMLLLKGEKLKLRKQNSQRGMRGGGVGVAEWSLRRQRSLDRIASSRIAPHRIAPGESAQRVP